MIVNFKCKETEKVFLRNSSKKFSKPMARQALKKLLMLHAATELNSLRIPPANRLEKLGANRKGQHSIRVNDQFRICFIWKNGSAKDVEIVDFKTINE